MALVDDEEFTLDVGLEDIMEKAMPGLEVDVTGEETAEQQAEPEKPLFTLEELRYKDAFPEPFPDDDICTVYNGGASKASELFKGNTQPLLAVKRSIWNEIQYLVHKTPNKELAVFLVLKKFKPTMPKFFALDLYFPKQETGAGGVSIDVESTDKFYQTLSEHPDFKTNMHRCLAHLHSHASMATFWSAADDNQQFSRDDLGYYDDYRWYLVVNTHNQVRCSFVMYQPFLRRWDNMPVVVFGKEDESLITDERRKELDSYIDERTSPLTTNVFEDIRHFDANATEIYTPAAAKPAKKEPYYIWPNGKTKPVYGGGKYGGYYGGYTGYSYKTGGKKQKYDYAAWKETEQSRKEYNALAAKYGWPSYDDLIDEKYLDRKDTEKRSAFGPDINAVPLKPRDDEFGELGDTNAQSEFDDDQGAEGVIEDFLDYCMLYADYSTELRNDQVEGILETLLAISDGMAEGNNVQKIYRHLRNTPPRDRRDILIGYASMTGLKLDRLETELPDDLVDMVDFIVENDWRNKFLVHFIHHRYGSRGW